MLLCFDGASADDRLRNPERQKRQDTHVVGDSSCTSRALQTVLLYTYYGVKLKTPFQCSYY
jgi:hypothetical protein